MDITPPGSPNDNNDVSTNILCDRGACGFHCIGETSKRVQFHPQGFLLSGDGYLNDSLSRGLCFKQSFVTVFGQLHDIDSSSEEDLERLFLIARNRLSLIIAAQKANSGTYGLLTGSNNCTSAVDLNHIRQELREFYMMLQIFITMEGSQEHSSWVLENMLPTILKGLYLLRTQLGWLSDLPGHVLNHGYTRGSKSPSAAYHLFHCHLELRWLHITVLWTLASWNMKAASTFQGSQLSELYQTCSIKSSVEELLQESIELTVVDLIEMSVTKFNKLNNEQITQISTFYCSCVRELWLLLRFVVENSLIQGKKSFWKVIDRFLELLVRDENPSNRSRNGLRPLKLPNKIVCSDPSICGLWLLRHIAELFAFTAEGHYISPTEHEIESNYSMLKRILGNISNVTDPSSNINESQRRVFISLLKNICTELWRPKPEPIMMLLESFQRNLDSAFQIPGAVASLYVIPNETVEHILDSVTDGLVCKTNRTMNSFEMFLLMLSNYLGQDPCQWKQKMRGRFYSKLSMKKVDSLSEMGLFHLTQLFLVIALKTDLEDLGLQFQKLLCFREKDDKRNAMVMKAQLCFLYLYAQRGKPLAPLVSPLTKEVNSFIVKDQSSVTHVFVENLEYIVNSNNSLPLDLHVLVDEWVKQYLSVYRQDTARTLLNVMVLIMQKIKIYLESNKVGGGVEKLISALYKNLLPFVKEKNSTSLHQIADLAVYFTVIALETNNYESFQDLLKYFMMSESSNVMLVKMYMYRILSHDKICNVIEIPDSQQTIFIQAWVRCCALSECVDRDHEKCVTEKILQMPLLQNMIKFTSEDLFVMQNSEDPLVELIRLLGNSSNINKKSVSVLIVEPLMKLLPVMKSSLFPSTKSKDVGWREKKVHLELQKDAIVRAFYVTGKLTSDCAWCIYDKYTSATSVTFLVNFVTTLIIPPTVFNMDVRLPLALDEGLRRSLPFFLRGLHNLDPKKDPTIQRFFQDIIKVYAPRLNDPFVKIWDEPEHMPAAIVILTTICDTLLKLDKKTNIPHKYYDTGLQLISNLVKRNYADDMLLGVLITNAFPNMLEVVGRATADIISKRKETEKTLQIMFGSEAYHTHPNLWDQTDDTLSSLANKYLSLSTDVFKNMLNFLMKEFRWIVKRFLPRLANHIKDVIIKRGCGKDKKLEEMFLKLKEAAN